MSESLQFAAREDKSQVEQGDQLAPKFDSSGLIPAIATDHATGELLMVAYMNEEAFKKTIEIGEAVYYSRSRQEMWHKGATSGHTQKVIEIRVDCDQDAVWLRVDQQGSGACHVGYRSCFYRAVDRDN
ncbi:phosphoribosyl-AMP cyclohydrolase, partial [bacterium]|nr:phosphoribosyl-AMP cyclohydrolase [bacterium]